ncbi:hypothetical protein BLNAU_14776 [Blattamonas nauphoetae]|uniref:Protein kinase domain-containing protein n=1 Tax=Blattamonas nauphoetae TaxID=2049346 RepID=A0ABQ9XF14_9EUKA|nr:hypothetical protein BLNAU_14776 [Blattamonas nauphoetae]
MISILLILCLFGHLLTTIPNSPKPNSLASVLGQESNAKGFKSNEIHLISITEGTYIGDDIKVTHQSLELSGERSSQRNTSGTRIIGCCESIGKTSEDIENMQAVDSSMFSLANSTLSLKSLHFSLVNYSAEARQQMNQQQSPRLAIVFHSMLTISDSRIELSPWTSAILISGSPLVESGRESSVVIQNSRLWKDVGEMRGIVETSAFPDIGGSVSVSIVGCSFNSQAILGKDGIGLSLARTPRKSEDEVGRISSSLIGCSFVNMSSIGSSRQPQMSHLSQKMLGCVVSSTSLHLSGSTIRDVNNGGSVLCSNSSFSSLLSHPNSDTDPSQGTVTLPGDTDPQASDLIPVIPALTSIDPSFTYFDGTTQMPADPAQFVDGTVFNITNTNGNHETSAIFSNCHFTGQKYQTAIRPLTFSTYPGIISIHSCSFANTYITEFSGATLYIDLNEPTNTNPVTVEFCNFTDCEGDYGAAGLRVSTSGLLTVTGCRCVRCCIFPDRKVNSVGGGMWLYFTRTQPGSTLSNLYFEACTSTHIAGGLNLDDVQGSVVITSLSFQGCSALSTDDGHVGAMLMRCMHKNTEAISISHLKFEDCSAFQYAGGLYISMYNSPLNITDCTFVSCDTTDSEISGLSGGGGLYVYGYETKVTLKGCRFIECSSTALGGAAFVRIDELEISDCLVQNCSSRTSGAICIKPSETTFLATLANTLFIGNTVSDTPTYFDIHQSMKNAVQLADFLIENEFNRTITNITISDCWTTSAPNSVGMYKTTNANKTNQVYTRVYHPAFEKMGPLLTQKVEALLDLESLRIDVVVKGKVPLESQEYEVTIKEQSGGTELTGRLQLSDETGTIVLPSKDTLKYNTGYTITKIVAVVDPSSTPSMTNDITIPQEAWAFNFASNPSFASFATPKIPPILKASCRAGTGTYNVTLKEEAFSFRVTFSDERDDEGHVLSSEASVRLFGDGSKLNFDTEYTLKSVKHASTWVFADMCGMIITFTTPQATDRIVGIGTMDFTNSQKDEVSVSLSGSDLVSTEYFIETSPSSDLNGNKLSVTFTDQLGTLVGKVYSAIGNAVPLKFGQTFEIVSVTHTNNQPILFVPLSFSVPTEPARIESTSCTLNGAKTAVNVTLTGRQLFSAAMSVKLKNSTTNRVFTSSLSSVNATSCTVSFPAAQTETDTTLVFGGTYDVVSVESSESESSFVVNTGVNVSIRPAPIITSISSSLSPNCSHFEISFSGTSLPSTGSFVASISPSITLALSYVNGVWTTGWLIDGTNGTLMNTNYVLTQVADGDNEMILNVKTFKTAEGPTLSSIPEVTLKRSDLNSIVISLEGQQIPTSSFVPSFDLIVVESGKTKEISIPVSFSSNEIGSGEVEVYKSGKLKYSTSYSVVRMTSTAVSVSIPSAVSFLTPPAPTRIISATCDLDSETGKSAEILLTGVSFPQSTSFTLTMYELDESSLRIGEEIELSSSFAADGSSTSHTLSSLIYENAGAKLKFGQSYEITQIEINDIDTIVDDLARFSVPPEPSRLVTAGLVVDLSMNFSTLTLTTRQVVSGQKYTVALSGTPLHQSNSDSVHTLDFDVDGAESITTVLSLYPDATLRFNHLYKVTSMKLKSSSTPIFINSDACTFSTPVEPVRIENGEGRLNSKRNRVFVTLTGLALKDGEYSFTLTHTNADNSRTITGSLNLDGIVEYSHTVEESNPNRLIFGETYTITSATLDSQPILFNSNINISIPHPPKVTGASFHFHNSPNTTCTVTLTGSCLDLQGTYLVSLQSGPTLTIFLNESENAVSPILLIGRPDTLQYSTTYTIDSIQKEGDDTDVVLIDGAVSFETGSRPTPLTMVVDERTGRSSPDCGDSINPCSSVAVSQPWSVSKDGSLVITKFEIGIPTLSIPSSASMGEKEGMIVVDGGILEIRDISVLIENGSESFVFLFGSESTIFLVGSSITGMEVNPNSDESGDVCSWSSGIVRLVNCSTLLDNVKLTHHSQGAINMDGGSLAIESSSFHDNSPNHKSFPSLRRNVYCTGSANITIESLLGGDGSKDHPSLWFSLNDCNLTGEHAQPLTPMFVPTLSTDSKNTLNKTKKSFSIDVKGSNLIPCGLWLEIVEVTKEKTDGTSTQVELTSDSCSSISESSISLEIEQSLLSSLNDNLEWRGRLVFGKNITSNTSFVIQMSSTDRIAQSVRENMKWWIPLIIVLVSLALIVIVVVVFCWRRRKSSTIQQKDTVSTELDAEIVEKMEEAEDRDTFNQNITTSHRQLNTNGVHAEPLSFGASTSKLNERQSTNIEAVEVLVCGEASKVEIVSKKETLFERLHGPNGQKVDAVAIGMEIVKGLRHLNKSEIFSISLAKWTPHWILFDSKDRVCLRLNEETGFQVDENGNAMAIDDGERWRAPEQSNGQLGQNEERVSVFRLGLVLLEIRTGLVPFGEIDATNASRQLCAGLLPPHAHVDEGFMSIVCDCLAVNPNERPLLMEVSDRLEQYHSSKEMDKKKSVTNGGNTEGLQSRPTVEFTH